MTTLYDYADYRKFLKDWLKDQPKGGRGLMKTWSEKLRLHPTLFSQIMSGTKELSLESAEALSHLLQLSENEFEYFLLLVQLSRAGTVSLKKYWTKKIREAQQKSIVISERLKDTNQLSDLAKGEFYSSWLYAGIRNLTALKEIKSTENIANRLQLPRDLVQKVIEFLLQNGLCIMNEKGLDVGPLRTHLGSQSPLVLQHHKNWRLEAAQKMNLRREEDLFFTFPMSLSEKDSEHLRAMLPNWIEQVHKLVGDSPSETVRCLNLDFFQY